MDIRADSLHSSKDRAGGDDSVGNAPWAGWQEESWRSIPMNLISNQRGSPSLHNNQSNRITFRKHIIYINSPVINRVKEHN